MPTWWVHNAATARRRGSVDIVETFFPRPGAVDICVVGASAGGVEALQRFAARLPGDHPGTILVVLHVPPSGTSALPAILNRAGPLPAVAAADGDRLTPGSIHVAVPGAHLAVQDGRLRLDTGPRRNGHRPAVDVLFRSAAEAHARRVVGVVMSGARDDGAAGLGHIKRHGGLALIQDPASAP